MNPTSLAAHERVESGTAQCHPLRKLQADRLRRATPDQRRLYVLALKYHRNCLKRFQEALAKDFWRPEPVVLTEETEALCDRMREDRAFTQDDEHEEGRRER